MTVTELRKSIKGIPGKHLVVLSCDSEGNAFYPAYAISNEAYDATQTPDCALHVEPHIGNINALVIWPNN
jgi:hypothetical protein